MPRRRGTPLRGGLRLQHLRLLHAFGLQNCRLPLALCFEDHSALLALDLHLPAHRLDKILGRIDVLDFDARDLETPRRHGRIDHLEQPVVDLVAVAQQFVEAIGPITVRMFVMVRLRMAFSRLFTS